MVPFLDRDVVVQRLFRPRREENGPWTSEQRVAVVVDAGVKVRGYLHPISATSSLVLLFHGNGELAVEYQRLTPLFAQSGLSLLVMDYRGYGVSDGAPSTAHMLKDAVTILDAVPQLLAERELHPRNIFVMGRSLGSAAACELAFHRGTAMDGLIIDSGFASTRPLLERLGVPLTDYEEARDGHGNARKIAEFRGPTLIVHGEQDKLIPLSEGRSLYDSVGATDKRLLIIEGADHNNVMPVGYRLYVEALRTLIDAA